MSQQTAPTGMPPGAITTQAVQSRFGQIIADLSKTVTFPRGLLGIPNRSRFVLANFPSEKMQQFTLLQSLEDHALSFITLPLPFDNSIIAAADLRQVTADLRVADEDLALLLIVSVHRSVADVKLSVNARAPLLIDSVAKVGVQYVFQSDKYNVQHMLG